MSNYSAQGSITIKRLRNGDTLYISLENNGIPLYQGIDTTSGAISPDWTVAANQPVITPKVTSVRGETVARSSHQWSYNGLPILFTGATSGDWRTDSTGKFQLNVTTGALKIIDNLADVNAVANGMLEYSCVATVSGVNYNLSKSVEVVIQGMGASSYYGAIIASPQTLDADNQSSTLKTILNAGGQAVTGYHVKWYKDNTAWPEMDGNDHIPVNRADVDGTQLFIAEFYLNASDPTPVARAGVYIIDSLDEFIISFDITSPAKEVAPGQDVVVKAKVINTRTNSVQTLTSPSWRCDVMQKDTWQILKTAAADTITVTTAETDKGGKENDVEVVAEVTFN